MKRLPSLLLLVAFFLAGSLAALEITDVTGKKTAFAETPKNAFGSAPPVTFLLYAFDPELLVGLNIPAMNQNNKGMPALLLDKMFELPVLGGWHGNAKGANKEKLIATKPDLILAWKNDFILNKIEKEFAPFGIPTVYIDPDDITKLPATLTLLGELFGNPERAKTLRAETERILGLIDTYAKRVKTPARIYYALGANGLQSECENSFHASFIPLIGAKNVHACQQSTLIGMETINKELLVQYNPEVIITQDAGFAQSVYGDALLGSLNAVKNKRVFLIPKAPFNFLDRPPAFTRLIGSLWLIDKIDPKSGIDIRAEVRRFYDQFLHVKLTDKQLEMVLNP